MTVALIVQIPVGPGKLGHRVISGFNSEEDAQVWLTAARQKGQALSYRGSGRYERGTADTIHAEVLDVDSANDAYGLSTEAWQAALDEHAQRKAQREHAQQERAERARAEREAMQRQRLVAEKAEELRRQAALAEARKIDKKAAELVDAALTAAASK